MWKTETIPIVLFFRPPGQYADDTGLLSTHNTQASKHCEGSASDWLRTGIPLALPQSDRAYSNIPNGRFL